MIRLSVNGRHHELDIDPATPLLYVLIDELGLNGAKYGCGPESAIAQCQ
jgi:nicotinate dehydrogenase subunit A